MKPPELTSEDRAEFWRKRHDFLLAQLAADKARYEFDMVGRRLNQQAEDAGCVLTMGQDGEPAFLAKPETIRTKTKREEAG